MSISSLSSQYISASFAGLMQYSSSTNIYDGNGNQITTLNITASNALNAASAYGNNGFIQYASGSQFKASTSLLFNESSSSLQIGASTATGLYSLAVGKGIANENVSAAFGYLSTAKGFASLATGDSTVAIASGSATFGVGTVASGSYQTVVGKYNSGGDTTSLFVAGNGTGDTPSRRRDAFKVTQSGSIVVNPLYSGTYPPSPSHIGVPGELFVTWDLTNVYIHAWHPDTGTWLKTTLT